MHPLGSVRARTAAASVLVVGAGVLAAGVAVTSLLHRSLIADTDRAALHRAQDVAALIAGGDLPDSLPVPADPDNDELLVQVTDPSGRIVSASILMADAPLMMAGPAPPAGQRRTATIKGLPIDVPDSFRAVALTTATPKGPFTVYAATELEMVARSDEALRRLLVRGGPPFLLLVALVTWVISDRALRRVEDIRAEVDGISAEALDRRVPEPSGDDEITRLARTMNEMLDRLQLARDRQRRFVADASHELKSPLAAVQAELEVALAHPHQADWTATASRLLAEDERMERLVADLLFLAQCDDGDCANRKRRRPLLRSLPEYGHAVLATPDYPSSEHPTDAVVRGFVIDHPTRDTQLRNELTALAWWNRERNRRMLRTEAAIFRSGFLKADDRQRPRSMVLHFDGDLVRRISRGKHFQIR